METEFAEKRANPRAQYFLVRKSGEYVPVFSFRAESDPTAIAALVTDMSEGGLQIMTAMTTVLNGERYQLTLTPDPQKDAAPPQSYEVTKIWTRLEGVNVLSGFSFADDSRLMHDVATQLKGSEHQLVRCTLQLLA